MRCCAASATRIQGSVRAGDTVARMGGDEFAILVEDRPEVAAQVAKRIARAFDSALEIGDNRVYVHLSIGVATAQPDDDAAITAADLLNRAEAARSRAEQTSATDVQIVHARDGRPSRETSKLPGRRRPSATAVGSCGAQSTTAYSRWCISRNSAW